MGEEAPARTVEQLMGLEWRGHFSLYSSASLLHKGVLLFYYWRQKI
jgi:hypothetical protein